MEWPRYINTITSTTLTWLRPPQPLSYGLRCEYSGSMMTYDLSYFFTTFRCVWKDSLAMIQDSPKPGTTKDCNNSTKLSPTVLDKLRTCCNSQRPTLRPSIQTVLKPQDIETVVLSAAVKHYGLASCVSNFELATGNLSKKKEFSSLLDVAEEAFFKMDALVRQLQAMAELEKKWWQDLMDICKENVQPSAAFFNDYHLQEVRLKIACSIVFH